MDKTARDRVARVMLRQAFDPEDGELDYGYLGDAFMAALSAMDRGPYSLQLEDLFGWMLGYIGKGEDFLTAVSVLEKNEQDDPTDWRRNPTAN